MGLAVVASRAQLGVQAPPVAVEVHLSGGLPSTTIVGLAETAVKESRDRVRAAIQNARLAFPAGRVTVNLAPADLPKDGCRFDLAIALGILAASGQIPRDRLAGHEFLGELALSGALRPVQGVLPAAIRCGAEGRTLIVPHGNAGEVALARTTQARAADSLLAVCHYLRDGQGLPEATAVPPQPDADEAAPAANDLADVRGQLRARRALEIAAAGGHNMLMIGPPGSGKTLLASCLPGILPPLAEDEALEVAAIASVAGRPPRVHAHFRQPPYRSPHHTASAVALVGGGSRPRPGEISLAHHGVLFLDELPEWSRQALEVLRLFQQLEYEPNYTIRCVMYQNEENGAAGAMKYADEVKESGEVHLAALESDRGGFAPRGFSIDARREQISHLQSYRKLLEPYLLHLAEPGYSGVDVGFLKNGKTTLIGFVPDSQRYFDVHHSANDVFENVNKRELELGSASIAALIYLIDKYGMPEELVD